MPWLHALSAPGRSRLRHRTRANNYGRIGDYVQTYADELCVLVQVETRQGLENLERSPPSTRRRCLHRPGRPRCGAGPCGDLSTRTCRRIEEAIRRLVACATPAGILSGDEPLAALPRTGLPLHAVGSDWRCWRAAPTHWRRASSPADRIARRRNAAATRPARPLAPVANIRSTSAGRTARPGQAVDGRPVDAEAAPAATICATSSHRSNGLGAPAPLALRLARQRTDRHRHRGEARTHSAKAIARAPAIGSAQPPRIDDQGQHVVDDRSMRCRRAACGRGQRAAEDLAHHRMP